MLNITRYDFKKGDVLICVINTNSYLTLEKTYIADSDLLGNKVRVLNDFDEPILYNKNRFVLKADIRNFIIESIIKEDE